ncbi:MAG: DegT/DnrJ/EryC1/StrS family aminotransferase, partial [Vicinamibacteria bacterium]
QYRSLLGDLRLPVGLPVEREYAYHSYVRFEIRAPMRDELRRFLEAEGIQTAVHYPTPIHLDRVYRERYSSREGQNPVAERLARETLSLPIYPQMTEDDVSFVVETIDRFVSRTR